MVESLGAIKWPIVIIIMPKEELVPEKDDVSKPLREGEFHQNTY